MRRRLFLRAGSAAALGALAGCTVGNSSPDLAEDPSPAWSRSGEVYHPAHRTGMKMIGTATDGDRTIGLSYTYAERFWTVTGSRTQRVGVDDEYNALHVMVSVWDTETGTVLPVGTGLSIAVQRDGETVTERAPWPMLSQQMGFHFGDNVYLPDQDTFSVVVDAGPTTLERRGPFRSSFEESATATFELDFLRGRRNEIGLSKYWGRKGERGALSPMQMEMLPLSVAPARTALPGRVLGEATSGDATFVFAASESRDGAYLTASPRTPYNRYVLPLLTLSATVDRGNTTVFDGPLPAAIGPDRSYHYGTTVDSIEPGDELTVSVDSPPQVARHVGYESAFLEMPDMTVTV